MLHGVALKEDYLEGGIRALNGAVRRHILRACDLRKNLRAHLEDVAGVRKIDR